MKNSILAISGTYKHTLPHIPALCARAISCMSFLDLFGPTAGATNLRGGFKTQPPVDRRFRPVLGGYHCLEQ